MPPSAKLALIAWVFDWLPFHDFVQIRKRLPLFPICHRIVASVTGLAGPDGDDRGNPVGTVFIGYADEAMCISKKFHFSGDRESERLQAVEQALKLIQNMNQ